MLKPENGSIQFDNVTFAYSGKTEDGETAALRDFTLNVAGGETVALVGESGAGKSTVFNLLLRLFDPDTGQILVDGQEARAVSLASWRRQFAVVSQETVLFDDSVAENIRFGRLDASDADIQAAARQAAADEFIRALPDGYDTRIGEAGMSLSGGQRQRLAIARAFLRDAPILLMDEATAALDAETERQVQDALASLTKGRTTLIIAHRLATVTGANRICLMSDGRLIDQGRHDDLVARNVGYERLARLQFGSDPNLLTT